MFKSGIQRKKGHAAFCMGSSSVSSFSSDLTPSLNSMPAMSWAKRSKPRSLHQFFSAEHLNMKIVCNALSRETQPFAPFDVSDFFLRRHVYSPLSPQGSIRHPGRRPQPGSFDIAIQLSLSSGTRKRLVRARQYA